MEFKRSENRIQNLRARFISFKTFSLDTQPMLQITRKSPNHTELRLMDSCIQILCRFQKSKQKVPPLTLPCNKKSPFPLPQERFFSSLVEELFAYFFKCKKYVPSLLENSQASLKLLKLVFHKFWGT